MDYQQYLRAITTPYWVSNPLEWTTNSHVGLAAFAQDGRPGMFNLMWLVLGHKTPPPAAAYRAVDMRWVVMLAGGTFVESMSLEHHAAVKTETEFHDFVLRTHGNRTHLFDIPGAVPWRTLYRIAQERTYL